MKKEHNQHSSGKCYDNYSYYLDITNPLTIPMIFFFYLVMKRLVMTKNSVVKIQKLVVNHESRPVKSNPVLLTCVLWETTALQLNIFNKRKWHISENNVKKV